MVAFVKYAWPGGVRLGGVLSTGLQEFRANKVGFAELVNLEPDMEYDYWFHVPDRGCSCAWRSEVMSFRTAPPRGRPFTFTVSAIWVAGLKCGLGSGGCVLEAS